MISLKTLMVEGRYDRLISVLSRKLLEVVKDSHVATTNRTGMFSGTKIYYKQGESYPKIDEDSQRHIYFEEIENLQIPLEFWLELKVQWIQGLNDFRYGGDAFNETGKTSDVEPLIEIRFELDPAEYPNVLSEVAMQLRDTLRHEIEHITQSGWNMRTSKYIRSDMSMRKKIELGELPPARYFTLPKEIPAMLQGMYLKAKKSKKPLSKVVNDYLDVWVSNNTITPQDKDSILKVWSEYLPKLGIRYDIYLPKV